MTGSSLDENGRRELERFRRSLDLDEGFSFHMVVADTARVFREALRETLPGTEPNRTIRGPNDTDKDLALRCLNAIKDALAKRPDSPLALDFTATDRSDDEAWRFVFQRLNENRNEIAYALRAPFVLGVSARMEILFGHEAPDFWSIRRTGARLADGTRVAGSSDVRMISGRTVSGPSTETIERQREVVRQSAEIGPVALAIAKTRLAALLYDAVHPDLCADESRSAVEILRNLPDPERKKYRADLADALNKLSVALSDLGKREEALTISLEAIAIHRELAAEHPELYRSDLAGSLNNAAKFYADLGQLAHALETASAATEIRRELATFRPDIYQNDLAMSLSNIATLQSELGRIDEALEASRQAVAIRREIAAARPEVPRPDLAASLNNESKFLAEAGRLDEALEASREAVRIRRELAAKRPDAFRADLAKSLSNHGANLAALGRLEEALPAAAEAFVIYQNLAADQPEVIRPELARACGVLGQVYLALKQWAEAMVVFEEGVKSLLPLFKKFPHAFARLMIALATEYYVSCEKAGIAPDAELVEEVKKVLAASNADAEATESQADPPVPKSEPSD